MTAIWWIRRDLRLKDNPTLQAALEFGKVLPVFVLDPHLLKRTSPRKQAFLFEGLHHLDSELRQRGSYLILRSGRPVHVLKTILDENKGKTIHAEEDYTPYARQRDHSIGQSLPLQLVLGQTVQHPEFIRKTDGTPYTVFTPYSRTWKSLLPGSLSMSPAPVHIDTPANLFTENIPETNGSDSFPAGELEAYRRLESFLADPIYSYAEHRNYLDLDGTSGLSPYLHFGMLGLRRAVYRAIQALETAQETSARRGAEVWLYELIWREFYIQILYHFPQVTRTAFNPALMNIPWRNETTEFKAWKHGRTGVPIVDAAMRQMLATGWMHNRARMIVASYLAKDLLVDWRWGERWFMDSLIDGDLAANNGGWQWTAGTGAGAAPYFRIFNPVLQSQKFDPHGNYIRRWVPELEKIGENDIHTPWLRSLRIKGYPDRPLVDRELARERTLQAYKRSKSSWEGNK